MKSFLGGADQTGNNLEPFKLIYKNIGMKNYHLLPLIFKIGSLPPNFLIIKCYFLNV